MSWWKTRSELAVQAGAALADLGSTSGTVADAMALFGAQGWPHGQANPVALYLHAVLMADPRVCYVEVDRARLRIWARRWQRPVVVDLPRAVSEFMFLFDRGYFPWLIQDAP